MTQLDLRHRNQIERLWARLKEWRTDSMRDQNPPARSWMHYV